MILWLGLEARSNPVEDRPGHWIVTREWVNSLTRYQKAVLKSYIKKHKITYTIVEK